MLVVESVIVNWADFIGFYSSVGNSRRKENSMSLVVLESKKLVSLQKPFITIYTIYTNTLWSISYTTTPTLISIYCL